jgi:hypothetical protein
MIVNLAPTLKAVSTTVKPEDLMLQWGGWVYFTPQWPDTYKWCKDRAFEVERSQVVHYASSYIIPGDDYKDIDLSNATAGLKLYPTDEGVLYEILMGLKRGEYLIHIYIPKDRYVHSLAEASMIPTPTDPTLKYLGAIQWSDSPHTCPLIKLYAIKDMPAFILRLYALEGVDFEKITIEWHINKTKLKEITKTDEIVKKALPIYWHEELRGF